MHSATHVMICASELLVLRGTEIDLDPFRKSLPRLAMQHQTSRITTIAFFRSGGEHSCSKLKLNSIIPAFECNTKSPTAFNFVVLQKDYNRISCYILSDEVDKEHFNMGISMRFAHETNSTMNPARLSHRRFNSLYSTERIWSEFCMCSTPKTLVSRSTRRQNIYLIIHISHGPVLHLDVRLRCRYAPVVKGHLLHYSEWVFYILTYCTYVARVPEWDVVRVRSSYGKWT